MGVGAGATVLSSSSSEVAGHCRRAQDHVPNLFLVSPLEHLHSNPGHVSPSSQVCEPKKQVFSLWEHLSPSSGFTPNFFAHFLRSLTSKVFFARLNHCCCWYKIDTLFRKLVKSTCCWMMVNNNPCIYCTIAAYRIDLPHQWQCNKEPTQPVKLKASLLLLQLSCRFCIMILNLLWERTII